MSERVTTIRLYGKLGAKFGRVHRLAVSSAAEAVHALSMQLVGFEAYLTQSKDRNEGYAVFYGKENLAEDQLQNPHGMRDIRIAPVVIGAKNSGWLNIVLGIVLVVAGIFVTDMSFGSAGVLGAAMVNMGVALIVGGVVQLLTPAPRGKAAKDRAENQASYTFNGPVNTQAQGNPVPVLYGELIVGSAVLSAGISVQDNSFTPSNGVRLGSGGGGGRNNLDWSTP